MHKYYALLLLLAAFCLSFVWCEPEPSFAEAGGSSRSGDIDVGNRQNTLLSEIEADARSDDSDSAAAAAAANYDKRVERYAFGLGRRAYTYTNGGNGIKRLPVYNFGLGKRARPYSFGLGKRADYEDEDQFNNDRNNAFNAAFLDEKRNRPYSFGLGKRDAMEDVERRGYPNRYGFGLGRR